MARAKRRFVVDEQGRKESVLLPVKEYEELLGDLRGLAIMAERNEESTESLDVVRKRLESKWQRQ